MADRVPDVSIVIPVYNEEGILREAVTELRRNLAAVSADLGAPDLQYEIILAENGSRDRTVDLARGLADEMSDVRTFSLGEPNYGKALRQDILMARGELVICDEIDLCDTDFYRRSLALLRARGCDMVVGSKAMRGAKDQRPAMRRVATRVINGMLRLSLDFHGTDTHGLKAFRRAAVEPIVHQCVIDRDLFTSELVIRAGRADVSIIEIPLRVEEKRPPSINLVKRVPGVMRGLAKLTWVIRFGGQP
jgi:glycosyltransferase involved in cell wall biosynthesis